MPNITAVPGGIDSDISAFLRNEGAADAIGEFQSPPQDGVVYDDYFGENRYEKDSHLYMLGITSPGGFQGASVAFVRLASQTLLWVCEWTAQKTNGIPEIPSPTVSDPNWVLLDDYWSTPYLYYMGDGLSPVYRINGVFFYGHKNPHPQTHKDITFQLPPWADKPDQGRIIPDNVLEKGISTPSVTLPVGGAGIQGY
jgi:hypothetical protein